MKFSKIFWGLGFIAIAVLLILEALGVLAPVTSLFGEITFYNDSGYMKYDPDEFDFIAGDMFELPEKKI